MAALGSVTPSVTIILGVMEILAGIYPLTHIKKAPRGRKLSSGSGKQVAVALLGSQQQTNVDFGGRLACDLAHHGALLIIMGIMFLTYQPH
jgi:hypothetical protein